MDLEQNQLASLFPNIAVQMRQNLANIRLVTQRLIPASERENNPDIDAKASIMDQSYYRLLRLVQCLDNASKLTDESPLSLETCDIVDFVGNICDKAGDLAPMLGLELRFLCTSPEHRCAINRNATEQILYHLLSNAFKFTPSGGTVTVELSFTQKQVRLSVTDTGCGVPENRRAALFERYRHTEYRDTHIHGLGLGLPLCRCMAERQGGTLVMTDSPSGSGSKFILSLPNRQRIKLSDVPPLLPPDTVNKALLYLSDALPHKAFLVRHLD